MNKIEQRKTMLIEQLLKRGRLSSEDVKALLGISQSSVRRLLVDLEKEGKALRVHGGIQARALANESYVFSEFKEQNPEQKRQIGAYAAAHLVENADVIYLDSGTTIVQLALALKRQIGEGRLKDIRVVTNSIPNMEILNDAAEVILIGGRFREPRRDFAGYASERFLRCFNYQKAFLGADGFDAQSGFLGKDTDTARLNEIILKRTQSTYILIDSSKFTRSSFVSYAEAADVTAVVTDQAVSPEIEKLCQAQGLQIIKAV